jgi:hypothetical protein
VLAACSAAQGKLPGEVILAVMVEDGRLAFGHYVPEVWCWRQGMPQHNAFFEPCCVLQQ